MSAATPLERKLVASQLAKIEGRLRGIADTAEAYTAELERREDRRVLLGIASDVRECVRDLAQLTEQVRALAREGA